MSLIIRVCVSSASAESYLERSYENLELFDEETGDDANIESVKAIIREEVNKAAEDYRYNGNIARAPVENETTLCWRCLTWLISPENWPNWGPQQRWKYVGCFLWYPIRVIWAILLWIVSEVASLLCNLGSLCGSLCRGYQNLDGNNKEHRDNRGYCARKCDKAREWCKSVASPGHHAAVYWLAILIIAFGGANKADSVCSNDDCGFKFSTPARIANNIEQMGMALLGIVLWKVSEFEKVRRTSVLHAWMAALLCATTWAVTFAANYDLHNSSNKALGGISMVYTFLLQPIYFTTYYMILTLLEDRQWFFARWRAALKEAVDDISKSEPGRANINAVALPVKLLIQNEDNEGGRANINAELLVNQNEENQINEEDASLKVDVQFLLDMTDKNFVAPFWTWIDRAVRFSVFCSLVFALCIVLAIFKQDTAFHSTVQYVRFGVRVFIPLSLATYSIYRFRPIAEGFKEFKEMLARLNEATTNGEYRRINQYRIHDYGHNVSAMIPWYLVAQFISLLSPLGAIVGQEVYKYLKD